jgi:hypothetical protein
MGDFWNLITRTFDEHSVAFVLLSAATVTVAGAIGKLLFDTILTGHYADLKEARRTVARYRMPLLQAADAVRGRIHNFTHPDTAGLDSSEYYRLSTLYVFCSYFAWVELLHGRLLLLRFESTRRNRRLNRLILNVDKAFNNLEYFLTDLEYRDIVVGTDLPKFVCKALGELSCKRADGSAIASLDFVEFVRRYKTDSEFQGWTSNLEEFLRGMRRKDGNLGWDRLHIIEIALVGLINFLDPRHETTAWLPPRFTRAMRSAIFLPGAREVVADDVLKKNVPVRVETFVPRIRRRLRLRWEQFCRSRLGEICGLSSRLRTTVNARRTAARQARRRRTLASQAG